MKKHLLTAAFAILATSPALAAESNFVQNDQTQYVSQEGRTVMVNHILVEDGPYKGCTYKEWKTVDIPNQPGWGGGRYIC